MRIAVAIAVALAAVAAFTGPRAEVAAACSCAAVVPSHDLGKYDGAFVGTVVSRRVTHPNAPLLSSTDPALWTFDVEQVVKGDLPNRLVVRTAASGASCGLEVKEGERVGLLLTLERGTYTSGLCSQTDPDVLASIAQPDPQPVASTRNDNDWRWWAVGAGAGAVAAIALAAAALRRRRA